MTRQNVSPRFCWRTVLKRTNNTGNKSVQSKQILPDTMEFKAFAHVPGEKCFNNIEYCSNQQWSSGPTGQTGQPGPTGSTGPQGPATGSIFTATTQTSALVNTTGTVDTTVTSAAMSFPFWIGNIREVASVNCSNTSGVTSNTGLSVIVLSSWQTIGWNSNGGYCDYFVMSNAPVGAYMMQYLMILNDDKGILQLSYKGNGAGGYTTIRNSFDCFVGGTPQSPFFLFDFFTITTPGNSLNVRWTTNGKNASSSAYWSGLGNLHIWAMG